MKKTLLLALLLPIIGFSQTIRTSTAAGDFINPLNWSPLGLPASGDSIIINHAMVMTTNIYYTAGQITINAPGSLIEDATDRSFWADGDGKVVNSGTFTAHLLLVSPNAEMTNMGNFAGVDSVWNQGLIMNTGTMESYDILNDETATFHQHSSLLVNNNLNNQGYFHMMPSGQTTVMNDFSNCNIQTMDAWFENDGMMCIGNNFTNCIDDTLTGSGAYFIGGSSSNFGVIDGTCEINTSTGTLGVVGTVMPGVTFGTGICELGIDDPKEEALSVYPNPTEGDIYISEDNLEYQLFDITGKIVGNGFVTANKIEMNDLNNGVYLLKLSGETTIRIIKK